MQRELLRAAHQRRDKSKEQVASSSLLISPIDLLRNDRSLLNEEQWTRLSNVINIYDTKSPVSHIRNLLSTQSKNPVKMRLKMAKTDIVQIIMSLYKGLLPFFETLPEFGIMNFDDQCELIERNLSYVGGFNGIIVFRGAEVQFSTAFKNGLPSIYGSTIADDSVTIALRTDTDDTLIKLFIPILLFSTLCYDTVPRYVNNPCKYSICLSFFSITMIKYLFLICKYSV